MRYALKRKSDGLVVNVIALESDADWKVPDDHELIPAETAGAPGDTHDGAKFVRLAPAPEPVRTDG